jgi:hypothetical protein
MTWFRLVALLFIVLSVCSLVTNHDIRLDNIEHILKSEGLLDE